MYRTHTPLLLLPIKALWEFVGLILKLCGRLVAAVIGLALMIAGLALCVTIVGAIVGVPLIVTGFALMIRGFF